MYLYISTCLHLYVCICVCVQVYNIYIGRAWVASIECVVYCAVHMCIYLQVCNTYVWEGMSDIEVVFYIMCMYVLCTVCMHKCG